MLVIEGGTAFVGAGACDELGTVGDGEDTGFLTRVDEGLSEGLSEGDNTGRAVPNWVDCGAAAVPELFVCVGTVGCAFDGVGCSDDVVSCVVADGLGDELVSSGALDVGGGGGGPGGDAVALV